MLQVLFFAATGAIVEFRDTEAFGYGDDLPEGYQLLEVTPAQYEKREDYGSVQAGKLSKKPPVEIPAPELTAEELEQIALRQQAELLRVAGERIAPLQDAVDLEEATPAELSALKAWKKYRVDLNRIQTQAGFPRDIKWPTAP